MHGTGDRDVSEIANTERQTWQVFAHRPKKDKIIGQDCKIGQFFLEVGNSR
jgi:hypothetical protein